MNKRKFLKMFGLLSMLPFGAKLLSKKAEAKEEVPKSIFPKWKPLDSSNATMIIESMSFEKPIAVAELDNSIAKAKRAAERNKVYKHWRKG